MDCCKLSRSQKIEIKCLQCGNNFFAHERRKAKFCSQKCSATYNNAHKTKGCRRSKLEMWIEEKLKAKYKFYKILFNKRMESGLELDIFFPDFKIAFELNGIFHYEPIYGENKLDKIRDRDRRKFRECLELGISLCLIDVSKQTYFKEKNSFQYLEIVENIIDDFIKNNEGVGLHDTVQNVLTEVAKPEKKKRATKINWPTVLEMEEILKVKSLTEFAKENGVSQPAVSAFCKKNNIKRK